MRRVIALMPWLIGTLLPMTALPAEEAANTAIWAKVRASLFADRPIREPAEDIVRLRVPARAADAASIAKTRMG